MSLVQSTDVNYAIADTSPRLRAAGRHRGGLSSAALVGVTATIVLTVAILGGPHLQNAGLRSAIETAISLSALLSAILLRARFRQTRLVRDLLLLAALATVAITDLVFNGLPAFGDSHQSTSGLGARLSLGLIVAGVFLVVAFASERRRLPVGSRVVWLVLPVGLCVVVLGESADRILGHLAASTYQSAVTVTAVVASIMLVVAGLRFILRPVSGRIESALLASAAFLLAGAWMHKLVRPLLPANWVTLADLCRLAAYGLLLTVALRLYGRTREQQAREAITAERLRIANDLHDGIAQDLAIIASHSGRLADELGDEHPLVIASRRALAMSRREIVDLSASTAPDAEAALREVAIELALRFAVEVEVHVDEDAHLQMPPSDRHELVRIAREGIVNAIARGGARKVTITLGSRRSGLLLRITDDGCGINAPQARARRGTGLGMNAMRQRARALGARLVTGTPAGGGTHVDVVAADPPLARERTPALKRGRTRA